MITNQLIWLCARKTFEPEHQAQALALLQTAAHSPDLNWDEFYETILDHKVAYLVMENLLKLKDQGFVLPPALMERHQMKFFEHLVYRKELDDDVERILTYFGQKSVDILIAKGMALSLTVYQNMAQYTPGDIDIMLKNEFKDIAKAEDQADIEFFNSLNYYPEWERSEHHDLSINALLPIDFNRIWQDALPLEVGKKQLKAFIMSPEHMLLFACINACRKRYFRVKSVCDIAEIIRFYPALDWQKVIQEARQLRCQAIVYTALVVTQLTVGCSLPDGLAQAFGIRAIRAAAIQRIARFLSERVPLAQLLPTMEVSWRKVDWGLLLLATTYDSARIRQRIHYLLGPKQWVPHP